jgi:hypothetical protein
MGRASLSAIGRVWDAKSATPGPSGRLLEIRALEVKWEGLLGDGGGRWGSGGRGAEV